MSLSEEPYLKGAHNKSFCKARNHCLVLPTYHSRMIKGCLRDVTEITFRNYLGPTLAPSTRGKEGMAPTYKRHLPRTPSILVCLPPHLKVGTFQTKLTCLKGDSFPTSLSALMVPAHSLIIRHKAWLCSCPIPSFERLAIFTEVLPPMDAGHAGLNSKTYVVLLRCSQFQRCQNQTDDSRNTSIPCLGWAHG